MKLLGPLVALLVLVISWIVLSRVALDPAEVEVSPPVEVLRLVEPSAPAHPPPFESAPQEPLDQLAREWIAAELAWEQDPQRRAQRDAARRRFEAGVTRESRGRDLLADVPRLLGVFDRVFPYPPREGGWHAVSVVGAVADCSVPEGYDPALAWRSVLVLGGRSGAGQPVPEAREYFAATFGAAKSRQDSIFVVPQLNAESDYDWTRGFDPREGMERLRSQLKAALAPFGEAQRTWRFDRRRMILDCGAGTCGFGLLLAASFPSRFAAVILRRPVRPEGVRLGGLTGVPMLLLADDSTRPTCEELRATLDPARSGTVLLVDSAAGIDDWMRRQEKVLFPRSVRITPTHDLCRRSHWVELITEYPVLPGIPVASLQVSAHRETNTIRVRAAGAFEVGLYLNDTLVDLDRPVCIEVNGALHHRVELQRSLDFLFDHGLKRSYDPTAVFTAYHRFQID